MEINEDRILGLESAREVPRGYHADEEQPSMYLQYSIRFNASYSVFIGMNIVGVRSAENVKWEWCWN